MDNRGLPLAVANGLIPVARRLRYRDKKDPAREFAQARARGQSHPSGGKGNVLLVPIRVSPVAQWFEGVLSYAFSLRGFRPISVLCNQTVRRCEQFVVTENAAVACAMCNREARAYVRDFDLDPVWLDQLVSLEERRVHRKTASGISLDDIASYEHRGVAVGRHARSSLSRYLLRGEIDIDAYEEVLREYLFTALVSADAARTAIQRWRPRLTIISHGIYATWGSFMEVCVQEGVPTVVWGTQYRKHCFILSRDQSYHDDLVNETAESWEDVALSAGAEKELLTYLDQKGKGPGPADYISYYSRPGSKPSGVLAQLGLEDSRVRIGLFPNLSWDARIAYSGSTFETMEEWLIETVRWFATHPDRDLLIRAHPAEERGVYVTQHKVSDILRETFGDRMPANVRVIPPESDITSYEVAEVIDGAVVYGTKFGLELVVKGKPVIVAGNAYYRSKGFTIDPSSKAEYFDRLAAIPEGLPVTNEMYGRALKYAQHFNFRRMYPIPLADLEGPKFERFVFDSTDELLPGRNPQLDDFIDRALRDDPFVFDPPVAEDAR